MIYRQWFNPLVKPRRSQGRRSRCGAVRYYCSESGCEQDLQSNASSCSHGHDFSKTVSLRERAQEILDAL